MLLDGSWRAAALTPYLTRVGADSDLDDSDWPVVEIPGHWSSHPEFTDSTGPVLFRRSFDHPELAEDDRSWLTLDGVMDQSDVWLDGTYLGSTQGYFVSHSFETTSLLAQGGSHSLSVEVACPNPTETGNRVLTGSLQSGPLAPSGNPGGIWRPVSISTTGPVAIRHSRLVCSETSDDQAELTVRLVLDVAEPGLIRVNTSVTGPNGVSAGGGSTDHQVATGENRLEWKVEVLEPELWWPSGLGQQPQYEVGVSVLTGEALSRVSDRRHWRTGLRSVRVDRMNWWVNGQKLFAKGIVLGPQSPVLARIGAPECRRDLEAVCSAGLNLVRVYGHVAPPELYAEADRLGLLIWQDMPLIGEYSISTRKPAKRLARSMVDVLGHHPSIALWCAHSEPNGPPLPEPTTSRDSMPSVSRRIGRHLLPSWSRSLLDPQLRRELHAADKSRTALTHSGKVPGVIDVGSSDPHLWLGWHVGLSEDLASVLERWPRLGEFLSGFGCQSVPIHDWPINAPTFSNAQAGPFERYLPRRAYADGVAWARATQAYQADLLRNQIETVRRLKYRPSGGFCLTSLADAEPDGGFGILDFRRGGKAAFSSVLDACRPVVVIADRPPQLVVPGDRVTMDVHAVSDLPHLLTDTTITARASVGDWSVSQTWEGELGPDTSQFIGTFTLTVPDTNGAMIIDVELVARGAAATNRYQTVVVPASEADVKSISRTST